MYGGWKWEGNGQTFNWEVNGRSFTSGCNGWKSNGRTFIRAANGRAFTSGFNGRESNGRSFTWTDNGRTLAGGSNGWVARGTGGGDVPRGGAYGARQGGATEWREQGPDGARTAAAGADTVEAVAALAGPATGGAARGGKIMPLSAGAGVDAASVGENAESCGEGVVQGAIEQRWRGY